MKYCSPCTWETYTCKTEKEILFIPEALKLREKVIKRLDFIGAAKNLAPEKVDAALYSAMWEAGIRSMDMADRRKERERFSLPCQAVLCEPLFFTFEDNTTFELMPAPGGMLRISKNQFTPATVGLNHRNVDATKLFQPLIGIRLDEIVIRRITVEENGSITALKMWNTSFSSIPKGSLPWLTAALKYPIVFPVGIPQG